MGTNRTIALAVLSVVAASLLGCVTEMADSVTWEPVQTYSGSYQPGWELSDFTPRGSRETWWLSGNLRRTEPFSLGYHPNGVHLFVTVEGQLSSRGLHGHLGAYQRELRVIRIISVKKL
jgi:hypothetical protein